MSEKMTAAEIKKAIIEKKVQRPKAIEPAEILGVKGFLFKSSSYDMEGWRQIANDEDPARNHLGQGKLVQISFRDEDGKLVFDDLDVTLVAGIDEDQIFPIYKRCLAINGFGIEAAEAILKNLLRSLGSDGLYALLASIGAPCPSCTKGTAPMSSASNGSPSATGLPETPPKPGGPN